MSILLIKFVTRKLSLMIFSENTNQKADVVIIFTETPTSLYLLQNFQAFVSIIQG
jgi:hypothetical protein